MAVTDPAPTWPIEPSILYIVQYYEDTGLNTAPSGGAYTMTNYNDAISKAKELITDAGNEGACVISQVAGTVVYKAIPWVEFP